MSRYFTFFALLALAAAYPAGEDIPRPITSITDTDFEDPSPWFRFPPFGNIFAPLTKLFSSFADIGPRIDVSEDKFRVIVNVKDYKKDDLKVKVKGDFILVQGAHEAKHDDHDLFASQFFHTYTLPINASASDVTATLSSDGYLDVTAPINGADEKDKIVEREVPIVESGKPLKEEKEPVEPVSAPVVPGENTENVANVGAVENFDKTENVANVDAVEKFDKTENVANVDAVENFDKTENVANVDAVEKFDKTENVANVDAVEKIDNNKNVANVDPVEKFDNTENVANVDAVEKFDKVETLDTPVEPLAKVETVDKIDNVTPTATVEKIESVQPTATVEKVENVEKVEPLPVTTEVPYEVEAEKKEVTTPASDREEVKVPVQDIKVPQDNEVNEIQP